MGLKPAYLLVTHGSRDPRPQLALLDLAYLVEQQLINYASPIRNYNQGQQTIALKEQVTPTLIETATLEVAPIPLRESLVLFAQKMQSYGIKQAKIVPLFLLSGIHVQQDIPQEVEAARQRVSAEINWELCPHLGSYPGLGAFLCSQIHQQSNDGVILIAHGTRRYGGNQAVQHLAEQLGAIAAFWSGEPGLAEQVSHLVALNCSKILILPYFLFNGGITDAIAQQVQQLKQAYPQVQLYLGTPIGATPELAHFIVKNLA